MELAYKAKPTRPVTHDELIRFVKAADEAGEGSLGTAAMIAYYWLQRETDIINRLSWSHYRPDDAPNVAASSIIRPGNSSILPLYDEDGTVLWPELMDAPRRDCPTWHADRYPRPAGPTAEDSPALEAGLFPAPRRRYP